MWIIQIQYPQNRNLLFTGTSLSRRFIKASQNISQLNWFFIWLRYIMWATDDLSWEKQASTEIQKRTRLSVSVCIMGVFRGSFTGSNPTPMNALLLWKPKAVGKYDQIKCKPPKCSNPPKFFLAMPLVCLMRQGSLSHDNRLQPGSSLSSRPLGNSGLAVHTQFLFDNK